MSTISSAELSAFTELYCDLKDGLQSGLDDITDKAFSKRLIARQTKRKINSRTLNADEAERTEILLDSLYTKIQGNSNIYYKFVDILASTISFEYLAQKMKDQVEVQRNENISHSVNFQGEFVILHVCTYMYMSLKFTVNIIILSYRGV